MDPLAAEKLDNITAALNRSAAAIDRLHVFIFVAIIGSWLMAIALVGLTLFSAH